VDNTTRATRRDFVKSAVVGAAALGSAAAAGVPSAAAEDPAAQPPKRKSKIRIGVRFGGVWLNSKNDDDLRFFKQIGVDYVDIELVLIKGYAEHGVFMKADLQTFVDRLDAVGLKIERANALGDYCLNAHLGRPDGQKEIDNLKRIGEVLADAEIPVYGIQACAKAQVAHFEIPLLKILIRIPRPVIGVAGQVNLAVLADCLPLLVHQHATVVAMLGAIFDRQFREAKLKTNAQPRRLIEQRSRRRAWHFALEVRVNLVLVFHEPMREERRQRTFGKDHNVAAA
jgi:hypothetical protein